MRYAIACENNQIFQHFGHTPSFLIVDIEEGKVVSKTIVDTTAQGHSALVNVIAEHKVQCLVCGGIGTCARDALNEKGISLISGAQGHVDIAINKLTKGTLVDDPRGKCTHHDEEHHHCSH